MKQVAVYHMWSNPGEPKPYCNIRTPTVPSIALLRAVSDIDIVVLDLSTAPGDWGPFPEKLQFQVKTWHPDLYDQSSKIEGWRHLSRIFDIFEWAKTEDYDVVHYVDTDVFFFQSPDFLNGNPSKFCWDGWNTGYFYCSPKHNQEFLTRFKEHVFEAIESSEVRDEMKKDVGYDAWYGVWDEMILAHMKKEEPDLFDILPKHDHCTARTLAECPSSKVRLFHGNGSIAQNPITGAKHNRGLIPLMAKEFFLALKSKLSDDDLKTIYGEPVIDYYEGKRFSLLARASRLEDCIGDDGLYHLNKMLARRSVI